MREIIKLVKILVISLPILLILVSAGCPMDPMMMRPMTMDPMTMQPQPLSGTVAYENGIGTGFNSVLMSAFDGGNGSVAADESTTRVGTSGSAIRSTLTGSAAWGGVFLEASNRTMGVDVSSRTNLIFALNTASITGIDYLELKVEDAASVDNNNGAYEAVDTFSLFNILDTSITQVTRSNVSGSMGWVEYTVPLSYLTEGDGTTALDTSAIRNIGFWNPRMGSTGLQGAYYIDNIRFE